MRIENRTTYMTVMSRYHLILIAAFIISIVTKPEGWWVSCLLFVIIELLVLSNKFTESISIGPTSMITTYFRFFSRKELKVPVKELELRLTKEATFRSPKYFRLKITRKRKLVYVVDSRDGFEEEELRQLSACLSAKT